LNVYIDAIKFGIKTARDLFILAERSLDILRALLQNVTSKSITDADRKAALADVRKMTKDGSQAIKNTLDKFRMIRKGRLSNLELSLVCRKFVYALSLLTVLFSFLTQVPRIHIVVSSSPLRSNVVPMSVSGGAMTATEATVKHFMASLQSLADWWGRLDTMAQKNLGTADPMTRYPSNSMFQTQAVKEWAQLRKTFLAYIHRVPTYRIIQRASTDISSIDRSSRRYLPQSLTGSPVRQRSVRRTW